MPFPNAATVSSFAGVQPAAVHLGRGGGGGRREAIARPPTLLHRLPPRGRLEASTSSAIATSSHHRSSRSTTTAAAVAAASSRREERDADNNDDDPRRGNTRISTRRDVLVSSGATAAAAASAFFIPSFSFAGPASAGVLTDAMKSRGVGGAEGAARRFDLKEYDSQDLDYSFQYPRNWKSLRNHLRRGVVVSDFNTTAGGNRGIQRTHPTHSSNALIHPTAALYIRM